MAEPLPMAEPIPTPETIVSENFERFPWWLILLWGILAVIVGIMFFVTPAMTTVLFIVVLGAYWLVGGLFTLVSLAFNRADMGWKIFIAIINIIAGVLVLAYPFYSTLFLLAFFIIFIGFWAIFMGCLHLYHAYRAHDAGTAVLGIISLIFGILLLVFPFISIMLVPFIAGALALVLGVTAIVFSFTAKKDQAAPLQ
ncbi:MAG TPA: DUF308 domain-containing protein [Methanoregulaceae archaeon]|nr:DUF308 domain-containing protein [Methanoregulaceae archaeon]